MKLMEILLSLLNKNLNMILLWFINKKVDEGLKLETDLKTVKEETEIKTKEEKLEELSKISDNKVLVFKRKLKEFKES